MASGKKDQIKILTNKLKKGIESYLDSRVKRPALETVDKELSVQQAIVIILALFKITEKLILDHGEDFYIENISDLPKEELEEIINILIPFIANADKNSHTKQVDKIINQHINKKHLLSYLIREINWISVSILSASYISSLILIRSIFELLIGIATSQAGSMAGRIESINYLSKEEHKLIRDAWNKLNAWAHPYGKWEKEICPVYYSNHPLYHPKIYRECFSCLALLTDLFLTITVERFKISPKEIMDSSKQVGSEIIADYFEKFPLFINRLKRHK